MVGMQHLHGDIKGRRVADANIASVEGALGASPDRMTDSVLVRLGF
jgi:hypothetical protein